MADTMPRGDAVYVVTDQRLAAITYTVLGGKPNELVGSYRFDQITDVQAAKGRLATTVSLTFSDGSVGAFEVPRMAKPDKFAELLETRIG
jgi:hypothetical protein